MTFAFFIPNLSSHARFIFLNDKINQEWYFLSGVFRVEVRMPRRAGASVLRDGPASLLVKVRAVARNSLVAAMLHGRQAAHVYRCTLSLKNK